MYKQKWTNLTNEIDGEYDYALHPIEKVVAVIVEVCLTYIAYQIITALL